MRIAVGDHYDIGEEFFRWEIATAVAGAILGINPFDQPDVEASKIATRKLTTEYEQNGTLPAEKPFFEGEASKLFADRTNAAALVRASDGDSLARRLPQSASRAARRRRLLRAAGVPRDERAHDEALQACGTRVRDGKRIATCLGFGPRFLHSTGQAYKGGPEHRRLPAGHLRRRVGPARARAEVHVRRGQGGPGSR